MLKAAAMYLTSTVLFVRMSVMKVALNRLQMPTAVVVRWMVTFLGARLPQEGTRRRDAVTVM